MLVLTRKLGEGIAIGNDIKIVIMQIKGKQVRIGIKAGPETQVFREEVYEKIKQENQRAATSTSEGLGKIVDISWKNVGSEDGRLVKKRSKSGE